MSEGGSESENTPCCVLLPATNNDKIKTLLQVLHLFQAIFKMKFHTLPNEGDFWFRAQFLRKSVKYRDTHPNINPFHPETALI